MGLQFEKYPSKSEVGTLAPELDEGMKALLTDGEPSIYTTPAAKPVVPDWSGIKAIRHYFGRVGFDAWPAWLYHPKEAPRLVNNQDEALALGICYRKTTPDEQARFGVTTMWDWEVNCEWRPTPHAKDLKFDPQRPGQGKTYLPSIPNPTIAQHELVRAIVPEVAVAVAQALKSIGPAGPGNIDPKDWDEFKAFLAWKESEKAINALTEEKVKEASSNALRDVSEGEERDAWEVAARAKNIKIDGRWSLERLKAEVQKAA